MQEQEIWVVFGYHTDKPMGPSWFTAARRTRQSAENTANTLNQQEEKDGSTVRYFVVNTVLCD